MTLNDDRFGVPANLDKYCYSVLLLCETMHMSKTGAGDPVYGKALARCLSALTNRLCNWQINKHSEGYDNAVRQLITETIKEQLHNMQQDDKVIE